MDGDAGDLGEAFLDVVFESGEDVMDASDGEIPFQDAVAGDEDVVLDLADTDIVGVEEFVVGGGHVIEKRLNGHFQLAHFTGACIGRGDVAAEGFDVDVDVNIAVADGTDAVFEFSGAAVGLAEGKIFVDFEVELDEEVAVLLGGGDIVDGETEAKGNGAHGFEEMLVARGAGFGVDDHVGGNDLRDALLDAVGEFVNLLEIGGAGDTDGGVHEIAIAGSAEADAIRVEDAIEATDGGHDFFL